MNYGLSAVCCDGTIIKSGKPKLEIFGLSAVILYGNMITNKASTLFQVRRSLTVILNLIQEPEVTTKKHPLPSEALAIRHPELDSGTRRKHPLPSEALGNRSSELDLSFILNSIQDSRRPPR